VYDVVVGYCCIWHCICMSVFHVVIGCCCVSVLVVVLMLL
jgi:hypothetical protein